MGACPEPVGWAGRPVPSHDRRGRVVVRAEGVEASAHDVRASADWGDRRGAVAPLARARMLNIACAGLATVAWLSQPLRTPPQTPLRAPSRTASTEPSRASSSASWSPASTDGEDVYPGVPAAPSHSALPLPLGHRRSSLRRSCGPGIRRNAPETPRHGLRAWSRGRISSRCPLSRPPDRPPSPP